MSDISPLMKAALDELAKSYRVRMPKPRKILTIPPRAGKTLFMRDEHREVMGNVRNSLGRCIEKIASAHYAEEREHREFIDLGGEA